MNTPSQMCTRCVMDTSDPIITFDAHGVCNHCTQFLEVRAKHQFNPEKSEQELDALIAQIKKDGADNEYDVILGLSGGVDSSYVAYLAHKKGLRILAIHLDNGWNAEAANHNIKVVADKLGIDCISIQLDWEEFKDLQIAFLKAGVPEAETPTDIAIPGVLHQEAAKRGIHYIFSGGNMATEGILPKYWHYNAKDLKYFKAIHKKYGSRKLRTFPTFGYQKEMYYKLIKKIKIIYYLNYIPFDKDAAMLELQKELKWENYGGKHHESIYTSFIQSYYLYVKFGIDYRKATLSTQICNGTMTRKEALKILQTAPFSKEKINVTKEIIAEKFGISLQEIEAIMDNPPSWYIDYPNDEAFLGKIYDGYRKIFKKEKLANF